VKYTLPKDPKTEVIINTVSEQIYYALNPEDALHQHECFIRDTSHALKRYIADVVKPSLSEISSQENIDFCTLSETGTPLVTKMRQKDIKEHIKDVSKTHYRKDHE